ncbi:sterol desaturase family protein [bacterium]|nr:sterol desaturase family protein [bacterium]
MYLRADHYIYPATMILGISVFLALLHLEVSLTLATYSSITLGAVLVCFFERVHPYRREWHADGVEMTNDMTFMLLVQVLLPKFLTFLVVFCLASVTQDENLVLRGLWPHALPAIVQLGLMLLLADFLRYWLHRAYHRYPALWRFHAVHHSPTKLYFVNVGRFHPIEKAVQYVFDSLPFILLGVSIEVLALYLVFYAINGFFQHCNIRLSLGWLNYILSGPELHRWHHSRIIKESDSNFGNNLIIWDLIFGTFFLPKRREVSSLGVLNESYPRGFLAQMKAPFVRGLEGPPKPTQKGTSQDTR